ncbi:MAG: hypothetical protein NVS1B13_25440 [Flavisolibacter sp.]
MRIILTALLLYPTLIGFSQYYYKDIVGTKETSELIKKYRQFKITRAELSSYDANNKKNEDFFATQEFTGNYLKTVTKSNITNESTLTSFVDLNNNVIKTIDSTLEDRTETLYQYNGQDQLISVTLSSTDSSKTSTMLEQHFWSYKNNQPHVMTKIKNHTDSSFVQFAADDKGNIAEEIEIHKTTKAEPIYYYYNEDKKLTDIVTYNKRAKRLLPQYMFEYDTSKRMIQQITVPGNSSDYLIWRYLYDNRGLRIKEAVYNKQKQLTGKIEYQYF